MQIITHANNHANCCVMQVYELRAAIQITYASSFAGVGKACFHGHRQYGEDVIVYFDMETGACTPPADMVHSKWAWEGCVLSLSDLLRKGGAMPTTTTAPTPMSADCAHALFVEQMQQRIKNEEEIVAHWEDMLKTTAAVNCIRNRKARKFGTAEDILRKQAHIKQLQDLLKHADFKTMALSAHVDSMLSCALVWQGNTKYAQCLLELGANPLRADGNPLGAYCPFYGAFKYENWDMLRMFMWFINANPHYLTENIGVVKTMYERDSVDHWGAYPNLDDADSDIPMDIHRQMRMYFSL